jgi:hypothetical protein
MEHHVSEVRKLHPGQLSDHVVFKTRPEAAHQRYQVGRSHQDRTKPPAYGDFIDVADWQIVDA